LKGWDQSSYVAEAWAIAIGILYRASASFLTIKYLFCCFDNSDIVCKMCHLLDHRDDPVPSTWTHRKIFQHVHFASRNMPNLKIDIISVPSHGKHPLWKCPASVNVTICRLGNAAADQAATTANAFAMEALQVSIDESKNRQTWMASSLDFLPLACFRN
jgi:hypothetical protein